MKQIRSNVSIDVETRTCACTYDFKFLSAPSFEASSRMHNGIL